MKSNSICAFFSDPEPSEGVLLCVESNNNNSDAKVIEPKKKFSKKNNANNANNLNNSNNTTNIKNEDHEEAFLSTYINNGCCFFCMTKICTKKHQNNTPFPDALPYFLERPMRINLLNSVIQNQQFGFGETQEYNINICTYIYAYNNCKNCEEGRFKFIEINGKQVKFCYPEVKKNHNKLSIWLHIDLKFIINSSNRINILEILPLNEELLTNNNKNNKNKNEKYIKYNNNDKFNNDSNSVVSDMSFDNFNNYPKMMNENSENIENNNNNKNNKNNKMFDYSKISKKYHIEEEVQIKESIEDEIIMTNTSENTIFVEEKKVDIIDYSKENFNFLKQCSDKDIKNYLLDLDNKNGKLNHENAFLLIQQTDLKNNIKILERKNEILQKECNELSVKVEERLREINQAFDNAEHLGNKVVETYRETYFDKYKILSKN